MMVTASPNRLTANTLLTVDDHSTTSVQCSPDNGRDDAVSGSHITTIPIHPVKRPGVILLQVAVALAVIVLLLWADNRFMHRSTKE